jgi:hypothetical protein
MFDKQPMDIHFKNFLKKVYENRSFLPIYRMADGEFAFCLDRQKQLLFRIKSLLKEGNTNFKTVYGENYSKTEIYNIREQYIRQLQTISKLGNLALHLTIFKELKSYENLINPVLKWFDKNNIKITPQNYIPFYFIYALFCKQYRDNLITDKDILIITSLTEEKKNKLENYFTINGTRTVSFINISPDKSLLDKIDLTNLKISPQLVLIAAGVGSLNILDQLKSLNALCIDIGIIMDAIINENLNKTRIFIDL